MTFALPYLPLHSLFGFVPLPAPVMGWLVAITILYMLTTEAVKQAFYARRRP